MLTVCGVQFLTNKILQNFLFSFLLIAQVLSTVFINDNPLNVTTVFTILRLEAYVKCYVLELILKRMLRFGFSPEQNMSC